MSEHPILETAEWRGSELRFATFTDGEYYYAVCREHYLMTLTKRRDELLPAIISMLETYAAAEQENPASVPMRDLQAAPARFWEMVGLTREGGA